MVTESMVLYGVMGALFIFAALLSLVRAYVSRRDYSTYFYGRTEEEALPPRKPLARTLAPLGTIADEQAPAPRQLDKAA